jgi:hypothetical protein
MKNVAIAALVTVFAFGCGSSAIQTSRRIVEYSSIAGDAADREVARQYVIASQQALAATLAEGGDFAAYEAKLAKWGVAISAITTLRNTLLVAQSAIDTWEVTDSDAPWLRIVACIAQGVRYLALALQDIGIDLPSELITALELVKNFTDGQCIAGSIR